MKVRRFLAIVPLILLITFVWAGTGCSERDSVSIEEMMKDIPAGVSSFEYCDLKAMRGDSDLEDLYNNIRNGYLSESVIYNVDFGKVNYLADCGNKGLVIFRGKFDLADIRSTLEGNSYTAVGYRDEEVWLNGSDNTMVALFKETVAIGDESDVKDYIEVLKGEADSILESEDVRDVMEKLPGGIAAIYLSDGIGFGSKASGTTYKKKDGDTMSITNAIKFGDAGEAEEARDTIEEMFMATTDYEDLNVKIDGEFIILTGQLDIADMVQ